MAEENKLNPHEGHRQRMRKMILENGVPENMPEHQLLEFLLFYTIPRKDTNALAHDLLNSFGGSIVNVLEAPVSELVKVKGISENTAALIKFILPLSKRYIKESSNTAPFLKNRKDMANFLAAKFFSESTEVVYLLCMDNRGRVLDCPRISEGDEISVGISVRTVIEQVIRTGATVVMLAHNHPKGFPLPSTADIRLTTQIADGLSSINVSFVDHIIIGNNETVSLAESKEYSYLF